MKEALKIQKMAMFIISGISKYFQSYSLTSTLVFLNGLSTERHTALLLFLRSSLHAFYLRTFHKQLIHQETICKITDMMKISCFRWYQIESFKFNFGFDYI
eukprot:265582_1